MMEDLDQDIRDFIERETQDNIDRGMPSDEARFSALRKFGNVTRVKEETWEVWSFVWLEQLWQDIRFGLRMLTKNPGFTAVAVLTLALGIGANTAVFSVVRAVLLRPLPYSDPDRLVCLTEPFKAGLEGPDVLVNIVGAPDYQHWRDQNQVFEALAAYGALRAINLNTNDGPERIDAAAVTWDFFPMLRVHPDLGRNFLPEEDRPGAPPVAVLSHSLWQRRFGSHSNLVGKTITLNEKVYTVVGIMPEGFRFPADWSPEVFVPTCEPPNQSWEALKYGFVYVIARLKPHVKLTRARSDLVTINQRSDKAFRSGFPYIHENMQVRVQTLHERLVGDVRPLLLILLGAVGFVLLLTCANVGNLQLARSATREKEFAVRAAIGAGRWRLARQLLVESLALAALGGGAGLILGAGGVGLLRHLSPSNLLDLKTVGLDPWVLAFTATIAVLAGVVFGLAPIFVAFRLDVEETLKEARPSTTAGGGTQRLHLLLMVSQVALALILLSGAGLLIRTFARLSSIDPGFNTRDLLTERILLPMEKYRDPAQWKSFFQNVLERVRGLPGVESVAAAEPSPLGAAWPGGLDIEGRPTPQGVQISTLISTISPSYFHTLRIPLLSGREFTPFDEGSGPKVAIVDEIFARRYFGQANPLGHRIRLFYFSSYSWYSIVGVVPNTRYLPLTTEPSPEVFICDSYNGMTLIVHTTSDPASLAAAVRAKVQEIDPNQTVYDIATMEERFSRAVASQRFNALVMAILAGMAVVLAAVGVYGVMAYSVSRRTHEIGIRRALGAQRQDVMRLILGRGLSLVVVGIILGLAGALALTRFLSSFLYGVTSKDPATFIAVSLLLAGVALIASYIPARRTAKVDPMVALRYE
jgi:putative ABC transport system permease protein